MRKHCSSRMEVLEFVQTQTSIWRTPSASLSTLSKVLTTRSYLKHLGLITRYYPQGDGEPAPGPS